MSVSGEFQRVLADCRGLLERADGADPALAGSLAEAGSLGRQDLQAGASRVLELLDQAAPDLGSDLEREAFSETREHLRAICRVILGR